MAHTTQGIVFFVPNAKKKLFIFAFGHDILI